jgi:hypothetical protein
MTKQRSVISRGVMVVVFAISLVACANPATPAPEVTPVERRRYLVTIMGCNDCHTAGYVQLEGNVPEEQWLTGDRLGFCGLWGTTYPPNLRLYMQGLTEEQWVARARELQASPNALV